MSINFTSVDEATLDEAAAWLARLRSDQVSPADEQAFALWLSESPSHGVAFDETLALWEAMGSAPVSADSPVSKESQAIPASVSTLHRPSDPAPVRRKPLWANTTAVAAVAATVLVAALVLLTRIETFPPAVQPEAIVYQTPVGAQQKFVLADGSTIELNTNSRLRIRFDDARRRVELEWGEAYFAVAKDPQRPFTVTTRSGDVTAVGTAFNINMDDTTMTVSVTEGMVAVAARRDSQARQLSASQGQQLSVTPDHVRQVEDVDLTAVTAWRRKTLIFDDTRLATALEELNRYLLNPVDTSDPSLQNAHVSGTFSLDDPETTLHAIIETFQLQTATNNATGQTRLYR